MAINRTLSGLIAKFLFYQEPLVWVEGPEDIIFYTPTLRNYSYRLESAGGKSECKKLASSLIDKDYPYVVVLDGDYEILEDKTKLHSRVVQLHRNSNENYLFEKEPAERVCCNYARIGAVTELIGKDFQETIDTITSDLLELIILDVAHYRADTGKRCFPNRVESLLLSEKKIAFSKDRIKSLCSEARKNIDEKNVEEAKKLVENFQAKRRLIDLLRGHFVFGILRRIIFSAIKRRTGRNPYIDDTGLRILLSTEIWNQTESSDHINLRDYLGQSITEAQEKRKTWKQ